MQIVSQAYAGLLEQPASLNCLPETPEELKPGEICESAEPHPTVAGPPGDQVILSPEPDHLAANSILSPKAPAFKLGDFCEKRTQLLRHLSANHQAQWQVEQAARGAAMSTS